MAGDIEDEPVRVNFRNPNHLVGDMSGLEYFKLFWWPVLGRDCASLYELLWMIGCAQVRGGKPLTRRQVVDALSFKNFDAVRPLVQHLKLVGLAESGSDGLLLTNPLPLISQRMYEYNLPPSLQALHDEYAKRMGFVWQPKSTPYSQPALLGDVNPPTPPMVAHERAVVQEAPKLVEFFVRELSKRLDAPGYVLRDRAKNIRIANSMLKKYDYDECLKIVRAYLSNEGRARRCDSLAPIARHADLYLNIANGVVKDEPTHPYRQSSHIVTQDVDITSFREEDKEKW